MRSAYTAGAVQPAPVNWADVLAQAQAPASTAVNPAFPGSVRPKSAAYQALPTEQQLHVFLASLPPELIRAPRIDWATVPSKVRVYLLYGQGSTHPDRAALALASGVVSCNGVLPATVYHHVTALAVFWEHLLARYELRSVRELTYEHWMDFGSDRQHMRQHTMQIHRYQAAALHVREYLHSLDTAARAALQAVVFPEGHRQVKADGMDLQRQRDELARPGELDWSSIRLPVADRPPRATCGCVPSGVVVGRWPACGNGRFGNDRPQRRTVRESAAPARAT